MRIRTVNASRLDHELIHERRVQAIRDAHELACERAAVERSRALAELALQKLQAELVHKAISVVADRVSNGDLSELLTTFRELNITVAQTLRIPPVEVDKTVQSWLANSADETGWTTEPAAETGGIQ
jgi:hypothetical protein